MKMKNPLAGAAFLAVAMVGGAASAQDVTLINLSFSGASTVYINGQNVYLGEAYFTADAQGKVEHFGAFCIDFYHDINVGNLNLPYDFSTLATYSNGVLSGTGTPLSLQTAEQIGGVANYGLSSKSPIVQAAAQALIWEDLGASLTNFGSDGTAIQAEMATLRAMDLTISQRPTTIYAVDGKTQGFVTATPEPAAWILLISALAIVGAALRVRRRFAYGRFHKA